MFAGFDALLAAFAGIGVDYLGVLVDTEDIDLTEDVLLTSFHALEARLALVRVEVDEFRPLRLAWVEIE